MNKPLVFAICAACAAAALAPAQTAHAKSYVFKFGDEDAACMNGQLANKPQVVCEVSNPSFTPPPPGVACPGLWGHRIRLEQGGVPAFECQTDSLFALNPQYAAAGTPQIFGSISCIDTNPWAGTKCTDTSTGNFFVLGVSSYQLNPPTA